eukprot:gene8936-8085_t
MGDPPPALTAGDASCCTWVHAGAGHHRMKSKKKPGQRTGAGGKGSRFPAHVGVRIRPPPFDAATDKIQHYVTPQ